MRKLSYQTLYILWAGLFALTAALGLLFPNVTEALPRLLLQFAAAAFFIPPWLILWKAKAEENPKHRKIVRNLAACSIVATAVLLVLNILSVGMGAGLGKALNAALAIVSAPMVCSDFYALPLFLWGALLMAAARRR